MLLCWGCITLSHLLGLWQWCLLSEIQGLACHVFPQNTWLLANLFSLFSSCIKLPVFHFRWGYEAVLRCYFFLLHTHHLWSLGISDKFPDCPKCRSALRAIRIPAWACPSLCGSATAVIEVLSADAVGSVCSESLHVSCIAHKEQTWERLCEHASLGTRWWFSSVHILSRVSTQICHVTLSLMLFRIALILK